MNTVPLEERTIRTIIDSLCLLFLWTSLYRFLCYIYPGRSSEWHCRVVTCVHATIATVLSFHCAFIHGPWPFTDAGGTTTSRQQFIIKLSLGYFLFDMSWCLYHQTEGALMLVHHCLSIAGLGVSAFAGRWGTEMTAALGGSECTNPLLQLRWFVRETGHHESLLGDLVDWAFALGFTFVRILVGGRLLYTYLSNEHTDVAGRVGGAALYVLSVVFWLYIVRYMARKYYGGKRQQQQRLRAQQTSQVVPAATSSIGGSSSRDRHVNGHTAVAGDDCSSVRLRRCDSSASSLLVDRT